MIRRRQTSGIYLRRDIDPLPGKQERHGQRIDRDTPGSILVIWLERCGLSFCYAELFAGA